MTNLSRFVTIGLTLAVLISLGSCGSTPTAMSPVDDEQQQPLSNETAERDGTSEAAEEPTVVRPFEDITVDLEKQVLEIRAWTCLDAGYLEQIACSPGTREHESLVVIRAEPSNIHAAMLMAGYENGRPGKWRVNPETEQLELIAPEGDEVDVFFRYNNEEGKTVEVSARHWIRDHHSEQTFPRDPWVFGGSQFRENPEWMGPGEHYVADMTGSIIGLVTFGDEVIGLKEVISDRAAVHEPEWEVHTERIPEVGTEVKVIIRPFDRERRE